MYLTITVTLSERRWDISSDKTELVLDGDIAVLQSMTYGLGEAVASGAFKLMDDALAAQRKAAPDAPATEGE